MTSRMRSTLGGAIAAVATLVLLLTSFRHTASAQLGDCSGVFPVEYQARDEESRGAYAEAERDFRVATQQRVRCIDELPDDWSQPLVANQLLMEASDLYGGGVAYKLSGRDELAARLWDAARNLTDKVIEHCDDPGVLSFARALLAKIDSW